MKTFLKKYGVDSFSKTNDWKSKYLSKISEIQSKKKETCLEKYGVENVSQIKEVYDKIIKTKIQNNWRFRKSSRRSMWYNSTTHEKTYLT